MIIKSFNLNDLKKNNSTFYLFYGENEGHKEEAINNYFLKNFKGEIIKYDENQILENEDVFLENCLNESLFDSTKIIIVSRVTVKLLEVIKKLNEKEIHNKMIIFNSGLLEKKSKLREFFEKEKNVVCTAFYEDSHSSLFKIAQDQFFKNKISISSENINLVIEKCSNDRKSLKNEINKILNYCYERKKVSRSEILKLINSNTDDEIFSLIDNCLIKNENLVMNKLNSSLYTKNDTIVLIRSFMSRLKRLVELKKILIDNGNISDVINSYRPPIFWKDKQIVQKQKELWSLNKIFQLLEELNNIETSYKKNYELSNNLIFDFIINTSLKANN